MADPKDLSDMYNTPLPAEAEAKYQKWATDNNRTGDAYDYDMRGAWAKGLTGDGRGHFPDTFKKPNHPTFSDQSQYHGTDGMFGGRWSQADGKDQFEPGPANTHWRPLSQLQNYFKDVEPNGVLLPAPSGLRGTRFGAMERDPFQSESEYFKANPHVAGMAAEDNRIVMNPYSALRSHELDSVRMNEAARIHMRGGVAPSFSLTDEQNQALSQTDYAKAADPERRATIAARIRSGDPSAGKPTPEQLDFVAQLRSVMKMDK